MAETVNNLLALSPDQRRRLANALMASQFDRPTPQDAMPTERASLLPLATYANGMTGLAFPGAVAEPVQSFGRLANRLMTEGYTPNDPRNAEDAFNVAGATASGGLMSPKPANALGTFGGKNAKMPDERMVTLYHGTTPEGYAEIQRSGQINGPAYFTPRRDMASSYGDHVIETRVPASSLMIDMDLPNSRLLSVDEANGYAERQGKTIFDWLDEGRSVGTRDAVKLR